MTTKYRLERVKRGLRQVDVAERTGLSQIRVKFSATTNIKRHRNKARLCLADKQICGRPARDYNR